MKKVLYFMVLAGLLINCTLTAEVKVSLIPQPQVVELNNGYFSADKVKVYGSKQFKNEKSELKKVFVSNKVWAGSTNNITTANVLLVKENVGDPHNIGGAYEMHIKADSIVIKAADNSGFFYAAQTLRQLISQKRIPCGVIKDWAAFKIRGFMHDLGRNFQPMKILKEHADLMAKYKMNTFHLHLTDYPGYRLESKKYPILNDPKIGEKNRQPGKFYTAKEMREFVKFCADRHILVIPEIDMPGHSAYFNRAFGTDMQSDKGMPILKEIVKEVVGVFPAKYCPYLHIGSDEVKIYRKNFMQEMTALIRSYGREVIYWRPGGVAPDNKAISQLWTGGCKPLPGMKYIDSRATYLNHMDPLGGVMRLFFMQPCWIENSSKDPNALGGILASWADNTIDEAKGGYGIYDITPIYAPMVTWSQNLWRGRKDDEMPTFTAKMPEISSAQFKKFAEFEAKLISHRNRFFKNRHFQYVKQTNIPWKLIGPIDHKGKGGTTFEVEKKVAESYKIDGKDYKWSEKEVIGGTVHLQHFFGFESVLDGKTRGTVYAQTYVYSPKKQKVQWWTQFGTPSSSGRRNSANPQVGQWNHYGADFQVNNKRIEPPVWQNPGGLGSQKASYKVPFTMEGYFYRKPAVVELKKGWNRILLRVPGSSNKKSKWMFTCVPVKVDGRNVREVKGLKFSVTPN